MAQPAGARAPRTTAPVRFVGVLLLSLALGVGLGQWAGPLDATDVCSTSSDPHACH